MIAELAGACGPSSSGAVRGLPAGAWSGGGGDAGRSARGTQCRGARGQGAHVLLDGILDFGCRGLLFAGLELCAGRGVLELDNGVLDELEVVHVELVEETVTLVGVGGREASKGLGGDTRGRGCRGPGEETPDGPHKRRQCAARHFSYRPCL